MENNQRRKKGEKRKNDEKVFSSRKIRKREAESENRSLWYVRAMIDFARARACARCRGNRIDLGYVLVRSVNFPKRSETSIDVRREVSSRR